MTLQYRRHFLRGAAGFTVALPLFESLQARPARAGDPPFAQHARFVCMTTQHGGVWGSNMFPADGIASTTQTLYPGHEMHHGALAASSSGGSSALSEVLRAPSTLLTSALVAKMNVIRGLDIPFYISHHTGGDLGNYARNDTEYDGNQMEYRPTIDQVMAYSSSFYPDVTSIKARSMHIGTHDNHCWGYANPTQQTGEIQPMPLSQSAQALFNQIFVPDEGPEPRPLVVDRVVESYRRLREGAYGDAARLGVRDKQRLDDHMDRLRDLELRLNAVADCSDVPPLEGDTQGLDIGGYSTDLADIRSYYEMYNSVIAAAFMCGTSRIAVVNSGEAWSPDISGLCCDWHQQVAHMSAQPDGVAQQLLVDAKQRFFESVFLDLAGKLDVEETSGITFLDNSLMFWTQESGSTTHDPISLPVITAGSAAGVLTTGRYIDYRNRTSMAVADTYLPEYSLRRPGLPYNRWLANVLMAMGLSPSEFERPGEHGYGLPFVDNPDAWSPQLMADASEPLPVLVA
jgi:hypothetical protein